MSATINNNQIENNPDSFFIELPLQVIEVEGEFHEILGVKLKTIGKSPSKQVLPSVYCPDCQIKMFERKTFLGMYKFECAKCGTVKKLKYSKRELMEVIASK
ncbi:MAG: hypothetical protein KDK45_00970 [Leptospiraceae bacterium]|nr:hypothetical protein [Leptospiraceae bacterium]